MTIRLLADENFHGAVVRGLQRRAPSVDIVRVQDAGFSGAEDPIILDWAAREGRVLLTHDISTVPPFAHQRVAAGQPMPGAIASNTLLVGERPASADMQFGWWYAKTGQRFTDSAEMVLGMREQNVMPVTRGSCPPGTYSYAPGRLTDQCDMYHFWSPHLGGTFFLFVDGSAHFLSYDAAAILPALASRGGGEAVTIPN